MAKSKRSSGIGAYMEAIQSDVSQFWGGHIDDTVMEKVSRHNIIVCRPVNHYSHFVLSFRPRDT